MRSRHETVHGAGDLVCSHDLRLLRFLYRQEQFELGGQFVFGVESVREVNAADSAIGMDLNAERFNVVCSVGASCEV